VVEVVSGGARVIAGESAEAIDLNATSVGVRIAAGNRVETLAGRVAIRLAGGASIRLDTDTRLLLAAADRLDLEQGAVYVDSGATAPGGIEVRAPAGTFRDVGTQFEVRVAASGAAAARLRVREGQVEFERPGEKVLVEAGWRFDVARDGRYSADPIAIYGPEWDWVVGTAPRLDIEGVTVRRFLDWIGRETGRRTEIAGAEAASRVETTRVHGSIERLTLDEALRVVLASAGLEAEIRDGAIAVRAAAPAR
jgi:ferric-dicitrate binding protein FerR (iron transport regulator)